MTPIIEEGENAKKHGIGHWFLFETNLGFKLSYVGPIVVTPWVGPLDNAEHEDNQWESYQEEDKWGDATKKLIEGVGEREEEAM